MNKAQKSILVILIILFSNLDFYLLLTEYLDHSFSDIQNVKTIILLFSILILMVIYYFAATYHVEKLSINHVFLFISLLSSFMIFVCKILYYLLILDQVFDYIALSFYVPFIILLLLAFQDNFQGKTYYVWHFLLVSITLFAVQYYLYAGTIFDFIFSDRYYTNPDRYEFIKHHYFSDESFSYLPTKIPDDATNIIFYFSSGDSCSDSFFLLEYDSITVQNNEHHAKYELKTCDNDLRSN